jgi:hypothetical protein
MPQPKHTIEQVVEAAADPARLRIVNTCARHGRRMVSTTPRKPAIPSPYWPKEGHTQSWEETDSWCAEHMTSGNRK